MRSDLLRTCWRDCRASQAPPWLDAVLCDPPYGIREGSRSFREYELPEEFANHHIPATQRVKFGEHLLNLLDFAARNLVCGGRLVFWLPTTEDYSDSHVPSHAAFRLVANCEQVLTLRFRRRMITLEKVGAQVSSGRCGCCGGAALGPHMGLPLDPDPEVPIPVDPAG